MKWQTCMLPRELIWEGVAPPQQGMTQCARMAWQKNNCKAPFIMLSIQQRCYSKSPISISNNEDIHKTEDVPLVVINFLTHSIYLSKGEIMGFMQSQSLGYI